MQPYVPVYSIRDRTILRPECLRLSRLSWTFLCGSREGQSISDTTSPNICMRSIERHSESTACPGQHSLGLFVVSPLRPAWPLFARPGPLFSRPLRAIASHAESGILDSYKALETQWLALSGRTAFSFRFPFGPREIRPRPRSWGCRTHSRYSGAMSKLGPADSLVPAAISGISGRADEEASEHRRRGRLSDSRPARRATHDDRPPTRPRVSD